MCFKKFIFANEAKIEITRRLLKTREMQYSQLAHNGGKIFKNRVVDVFIVLLITFAVALNKLLPRYKHLKHPLYRKLLSVSGLGFWMGSLRPLMSQPLKILSLLSRIKQSGYVHSTQLVQFSYCWLGCKH